MMKSVLTKLGASSIIALGIMINLLIGIQAANATSTIPTSGTCGFVLSGSYPFVGAQLNGAGTSASGSLNWLGTIDFGASTINVNVVSQSATNTNGNNPAYTDTQSTITAPFTVGSPASGLYPLTLSNGGGIINIIPVNGGNTILMQQFVTNAAGGKAGVCQF